MAAIIADCPHCTGEKIGFTFVGEHLLSPRGAGFMDFLTCNKCQGGIIRIYKQTVDYGTASPAQCKGDPSDFGFVLQDFYPKVMAQRTPQHVPDNLARFFAQAMDNCRRGNYDASAVMSRKVIDVSTQILLGDDAKKHGNIKSRVDIVAERGLITKDLKEWAHEVRLGGAEAAHEEALFQKSDAEELLDFTELYLTYVYTLPKRLEERKARAAAEKAGKT